MNLYQLSGANEQGVATVGSENRSFERGNSGADHEDLQHALVEIDDIVDSVRDPNRNIPHEQVTSETSHTAATVLSSQTSDEENPAGTVTVTEVGGAEIPPAPGEPERELPFQAVLADDPQRTRESMLQSAVEAKDVQIFDETGGKWKRRMPFAIGGIVLIALAAVGASLGIIVPRQRNSVFETAMPTEFPSEAPSQAPSQAPTTASFSVVAQAVESIFGTTFDDTTSPQYRAARWMAEQDQLITSPSDDLNRFAKRYAMVLFYYATGGDTWTRQANFLSPTLDICSWQEAAPPGIQSVLKIDGTLCANNGQQEEVIAIEFSRNNLTGTLPDELGTFQFLNGLLLNWNFLSGTVPTTIFQPNFQFLSLPFNNISGTIPTEIGQFGVMIQVWFQESSLTGTIPPELGANTGLQALTLSYSSLNGTLPESLMNFSELLYLDVSNNQLSGPLPPTFPTRWPKVEQAGFNNNQFTGSLPNDVGTLSSLGFLAVSNNSLTGTIPDSLMICTGLSLLSLDFNQLTGSLPNDWSRLSLLTQFTVSDNLMTGTLPASFGNLTRLFNANFANNSFSSTIPAEFGSLTRIQNILFQANSLTGEVPIDLRQWSSLNILTLSENDLIGDLSFLCDTSDPTTPWSSTITALRADCLGEVVCPCCTFCCDENDECELQ